MAFPPCILVLQYRIFSIKHRAPIKRRLRVNAGSKLPIFKKKRPVRLIGAPAFIRSGGHKDRLQVNSNLLNGTVTTYQVRYAVLVLHHSCIVYVLFVSDTNLDCNMVHVPYVRYHNTVTSGNPGKNRPALTNCP